MMNMAFTRTCRQLLAGTKTVTRRNWKPRYAKIFREGQRVKAWTASPHRKGKPVAIIQVDRVYQERLADMPASELGPEGGRWSTVEEFIGHNFDGDSQLVVTVLRFHVVEILPHDGTTVPY